MLDTYASITAALGVTDGYILPWHLFGGCQVVSHRYRRALSCPEKEAVWRCEVIGPHTRHRWSDHTIAHERYGNGHSCWTVGDPGEALGSMLDRLYPWSRVGKPWTPDHAFEGDGPHCTAWIEGKQGGGAAGTITFRSGCGWPRSSHPDTDRKVMVEP